MRLTNTKLLSMTYYNQYKKLAGYPCVSRPMGEGGFDCTLAGKRGEIWETGQGMYKCFALTKSGNEKITLFNIKDLPMWISRLEVPHNPNEQLLWANGVKKRI